MAPPNREREIQAKLVAIELRLDRIEQLLLALAEDSGVEVDVPRCGSCGSEIVEDTSEFGKPRRITCLTCGRSTQEQEAPNG